MTKYFLEKGGVRNLSKLILTKLQKSYVNSWFDSLKHTRKVAKETHGEIRDCLPKRKGNLGF